MFPAEFADLLNARGRKLLDSRRPLDVFRRRGATPIALFDDVIEPRIARRCVVDLEAAMGPVLHRMHTPIPREALTAMKENYGEALHKTVRVKTATFNSRRSRALDAAKRCGLARMLASESWFHFAEAVIGEPLRRDQYGRQVICYETGDYSGPHNDHHPQRKAARTGFVDLHVMFSNEAVASQLLVYEEKGFLSAAHEVASPAAIAIYRLPFWHYTTPLLARPGRERDARRWLLLGSFDFERPPRKLRYRW